MNLIKTSSTYIYVPRYWQHYHGSMQRDGKIPIYTCQVVNEKCKGIFFFNIKKIFSTEYPLMYTTSKIKKPSNWYQINI